MNNTQPRSNLIRGKTVQTKHSDSHAQKLRGVTVQIRSDLLPYDTSSQKANFHPVQEKMVETYLEQLVSTDQRLSYSRRQLSILSEY